MLRGILSTSVRYWTQKNVVRCWIEGQGPFVSRVDDFELQSDQGQSPAPSLASLLRMALSNGSIIHNADV